jgi:hypothetical protein
LGAHIGASDLEGASNNLAHHYAAIEGQAGTAEASGLAEGARQYHLCELMRAQYSIGIFWRAFEALFSDCGIRIAMLVQNLSVPVFIVAGYV